MARQIDASRNRIIMPNQAKSANAQQILFKPSQRSHKVIEESKIPPDSERDSELKPF